MPRTFKLTWQPGADQRPGRWRKRYRGKLYYFPGGRGKSDRDAYLEALQAWERQKATIDAQTPKLHQADYERELGIWESVLAWCRENDEQSMAGAAVEKTLRLRKCLAAAKPRPVPFEDTFDAQFDLSVRNPKLATAMEETAATVLAITDEKLSQIAPDIQQASNRPVVVPNASDVFVPDELKTEQQIWQDRLTVMQRSAVSTEQSVHAYAEKFFAVKKAAVDAGELSAGRFCNLHSYVTEFVDWCGRQFPVADINGQTLSNYQVEVLQRREAKGWSSHTAKDRVETTKSFIRWLWMVEAIPTLPRNMDNRSGGLKISIAPSTVVVYEKAEITKLLKAASERTQLYILLMLNCGMTQVDIADLTHAEVDWRTGRIRRKRSKTRGSASVPEVDYILWPRTAELLRKHRTESAHGLVLVNASGGPLRYEEAQADGKLKKNDNIRSAFSRLRLKTKINKPLKSLKKTSASMIRDDPRFASLESLFLGHAPQKMSDKHYTRPPQSLLDAAIVWLASEYGLTTEPSAK